MRSAILLGSVTALTIAGLVASPFWLAVTGDLLSALAHEAMAAPLLWGGYFGAVACLAIAVGQSLDRRGLWATLWYVLAVSLYALHLAARP